MKNLIIALFLLPLSLYAGGSPEEIKAQIDPFDQVIEKYCANSKTGFGEIIPAKEDQYVRAVDLPDKYMLFTCAEEVKIKYRQKQGIVTIEALKFQDGKQIDILASIEGTEEGVKTKELKRLYQHLKELRAKILARN